MIVPLDKVEIASRSYKEVLDATVHQDDKVGRILTAAAFLTTGALTIITRIRGSERPARHLGGQSARRCDRNWRLTSCA